MYKIKSLLLVSLCFSFISFSSIQVVAQETNDLETVKSHLDSSQLSIIQELISTITPEQKAAFEELSLSEDQKKQLFAIAHFGLFQLGQNSDIKQLYQSLKPNLTALLTEEQLPLISKLEPSSAQWTAIQRAVDKLLQQQQSQES